MSASKDWNSSGDRVVVGSYSQMDNIFSGGGSICCWAFPRSNGIGTTVARLAQKGPGTLQDPGWRWTFRGDNGISFSYRFDFAARWDTTTEITYNEWTYFSVTYNNSSTSNQPKIYFNSIEQPFDEGVTPTGFATSDAGQNLFIGNINELNRTADGFFSYFQMWDRIISQKEIKESMHKPGSIRDGLVGFWPLTDDGSTQRNLIGIGNTGAVTGATNSADGPPVTSFK